MPDTFVGVSNGDWCQFKARYRRT